MDEKYLEMAQAQEEAERQAGIDKIPKYKGNYTHCKEHGCGVELPDARKSIGVCIDCAEDLERIDAAHKRNFGTSAPRIENPDDLFDLHPNQFNYLEEEQDDEE